MSKITMAFSLDDKVDRDILDFFAALPRREKSRTFRAMARAYIAPAMGTGDLTLGDLYQLLVEIKRLLQQGIVPVPGQPDPSAGPADDPLLARVEDALSGLGL